VQQGATLELVQRLQQQPSNCSCSQRSLQDVQQQQLLDSSSCKLRETQQV
jgi:hypothetical protein